MDRYALFLKNGNPDYKKKYRIVMTKDDLLEIKKLPGRFAHNCKCSMSAQFEIMKFNFESYAWEQLGYFCLMDAKKIIGEENDKGR